MTTSTHDHPPHHRCSRSIALLFATKVHQTGKAFYTLALAERITTVVVLKEKSIHQDTEKQDFFFWRAPVQETFLFPSPRAVQQSCINFAIIES
jgi:hypothetical protein